MEKKRQVLIDADACPVYKKVIEICLKRNIPYTLICDVSHDFGDLNAIYVDQGSDYADYKILELTNKNDIVVTQDYALASLLLLKEAKVINQFGLIYTNDNILELLSQRQINAKLRKAKIKTNNQKKRTTNDDQNFLINFLKLIEN